MTDTTTQTNPPSPPIGEIEEVETGAVTLVDNAKSAVETAVDAVKADVTGDASGVGKALAADDAAVKTEAKTIEADTTTDIQKAKASVEAAVTHIDNSGIVSSELTKAKNLLAHILQYIEAHI